VRSIPDAAAAGPGDVLLIAGKGHEDYQIVGTTRAHFDDRLVRLQFDDQRALVEAPADLALPFQDPQFIDVFDRSRDHQFPEHVLARLLTLSASG